MTWASQRTTGHRWGRARSFWVQPRRTALYLLAPFTITSEALRHRPTN